LASEADPNADWNADWNADPNGTSETASEHRLERWLRQAAVCSPARGTEAAASALVGEASA